MTFSQSLLAALSDDETRPHLRHVHVRQGRARATDGHRLHEEPTDLRDGAYALNDLTSAWDLVEDDHTDTIFSPSYGPVFDHTCALYGQRPDRHYHSPIALLRQELLGFPKAWHLSVPVGEGDFFWFTSMAESVEKKRTKDTVLVKANPILTLPRPDYWTPTGKGPYLNAAYLIDAWWHVGASEVWIGKDLLDPVTWVHQDRFAMVMPMRI